MLTRRSSPRLARPAKAAPGVRNLTLATVHGISITWGDLERLEEGEFLNDNLIDFYLKYIQEAIAKRPGGEVSWLEL